MSLLALKQKMAAKLTAVSVLIKQIDFNVYKIQPPNMLPPVFFNYSALIPVSFVWLN